MAVSFRFPAGTLHDASQGAILSTSPRVLMVMRLKTRCKVFAPKPRIWANTRCARADEYTYTYEYARVEKRHKRSMVIMMMAAAEMTIFRRRRQPRVYAPEEFAGAKLVRRCARATGLRTHPVPNTSPNTDMRARAHVFGARPSVTSAFVCVSVHARAYSGMIRVLSVG